MNLEVYYRPNSEFTFKAEARNMEDIFKTIGPLQEIMHNCKCGKCGSEKIRLSHRMTADGKHDVYELSCTSCSAKLSLGKSTEGHLFPRKYRQDPDDPKKPMLDKDGKKVWLPDNGWMKWDFKQQKMV